MTPDADESARLLTDRIRRRIPTAYFRFGDGLIECLSRPAGKTNTCDGEVYTPELALALRGVLEEILASPAAILGDWGREPETTLYLNEWLSLTADRRGKLLHFEALLLQRRSEALVDFYRAVRSDGRSKLFMGPRWNQNAAFVLNADFCEVPDHDLFHSITRVEDYLEDHPFHVLLYGAGMAGNIPVAHVWKRHPDRTYINLGSAMDPLFKGRTRSNQIELAAARAMFAELLA